MLEFFEVLAGTLIVDWWSLGCFLQDYQRLIDQPETT
jgi:hypothetical protein